MDEPHNNPRQDPQTGSGRDSAPRTPRWVYIFGIIAAVLVLAFAIFHLAGGGMGRHAPASSGWEYGVRQP
ncbi:hypothetical protein [Arthrobacter sp. VKM Ac-2550]|uniref:hypothetical protein n=1 Tax=Crystallibacter permensis TaxID=1938888 RepID=UPI0022279506|nr:hypothetical protein [Arthrobacter sp. VKM Ac-2550]MCW2134165.1 hypothetical protein [Arthrobacter sp. VKM Ac-2550]